MVQEQDDTRVPEEEPVEDVDFEPEEELGDLGAAKQKLAKLKEELERVKKERQEYLDGWQRCKADSVNARKDALQSVESAKVRAKEGVIESLLPVLDSFDMAMQGEAWQNVDTQWRVGVESIHGQFISALESAGVTTFGKVGEPYDVFTHHAIQEIEGGGASGTIARVIRSGWRAGERTIRPAEVIIFK